MPRISLRTPEIEQEILERMSRGEPLAEICRSEGMPHMSTWREWCRNDEKLNIAHGHARDDGYDALAAETLRIADDGTNDFVDKMNAEGEVIGKAFDKEHVQRSKLRVDTRLNLLAKWDPRRYGNKYAVGGAEDLPPIDSKYALSEAALIAIAARAQVKEADDT